MRATIVIPALDEGDQIGGVVEGVRKAGFPEIIVVDDGSHDKTASAARDAGAKVISHCCNCGVGAAAKTGWEAAVRLGADVVVLLDADGQHDPGEIAAVAEPVMAGEADIVIGERLKERGRMPAMRRLFNLIADVVTFLLSGIWLSDSQSGFRAISRKALEHMEIESSGFEFCTEMVMEAARLKLELKRVPIKTIYLPGNNSKGQNYSTGLDTVFKLVVRSLMR